MISNLYFHKLKVWKKTKKKFEKWSIFVGKFLSLNYTKIVFKSEISEMFIEIIMPVLNLCFTSKFKEKIDIKKAKDQKQSVKFKK